MQDASRATQLNFSVNWSNSLPKPLNVLSSISIRSDYIRELEQISRELRPNTLATIATHIGKIDSLDGYSGLDGRMLGDIRVTFINDEDDSSEKAKITLHADQYLTACDAHRDNRYIKVLGTFIKKPRVSEIKDLQSFEVIF